MTMRGRHALDMRHVAVIISVAAVFIYFIYTSFISAEDNFEYKLQPSDVLNITVHGHPDLTTKTRITNDGNITFPLIGTFKCSDITVKELEQKLKTMLESNFLTDAQPVVFIEEYHSREISVIGQVARPGKYEMPKEKEMTLIEAIAMAGGFAPHANINDTKLIRMVGGKQEIRIVRVKDMIDKGEMERETVLMPGDVIAVPEPRQFSIIGEVNKPGKYDMSNEKQMTVLDAIAMSGGFTKNANTDGTKIIRVKNGQKSTIMVNVKDIIEKGLSEKDIVLEPDDIVAVPEPRQVSVIGEVKNPGKYEMSKEKEMTLLEAIALAGGFTKDADKNRTKIIRISGGEKQTIIVPAEDIIEKGAKDKDVPLEPDDIVSVPESFF